MQVCIILYQSRSNLEISLKNARLAIIYCSVQLDLHLFSHLFSNIRGTKHQGCLSHLPLPWLQGPKSTRITQTFGDKERVGSSGTWKNAVLASCNSRYRMPYRELDIVFTHWELWNKNPPSFLILHFFRPMSLGVNFGRLVHLVQLLFSAGLLRPKCEAWQMRVSDIQLTIQNHSFGPTPPASPPVPGLWVAQ